MTGCFDFRLRASPSVDLDRIQATHDPCWFPMSFSKLFRSRSDGSVKTARSRSEDPTARTRSRGLRNLSPVTSAGNRRRYVRVVRSDDIRDTRHTAAADSAHVIVRSRSYSDTDRLRLKKSASADAEVAVGPRGALLARTTSPYTASGHTILKKHTHSMDGGTGVDCNASSTAGAQEASPPNSKHASFREEVEILEYDTHGKALLVKCVTHTKKLNYEDDDMDEEEEAEEEDDSLNIDDGLDDDLESTDFSLAEIQDDETPGSETASASSTVAISIRKLSLESAAAEKAATQSTVEKNHGYSIDKRTSSSAADYSTFNRNGLSLSTPSSAPPNHTTHEVLHSSGKCDGGTPSVVESCLVATVF